MALTGTLEDFGIAEILQLIGQQAKSGVLHLARGSEEVRITLADGCVVSAEDARRAQRDKLGELLVRAELLHRDDLDAALEVQRRTLRRLGDLLVERRLVSADDLRQMTALQTTETVYRLFDWKSGTYRFEASTVDWDPASASPLRAESILMEGFRRIDEWPLVRRKITSAAMTFRRLVDLADPVRKPELTALSANARLVFGLIQPGLTLEHIAGLSRIGEFETSKALLDLVNLKLVEALAPPRRAASVSAYARGWAERLKRGALGVAVTLALALVLSTLAFLASERGVTLEEGGGSVLRDHTAQRFLARFQTARLRRALDVYRLEEGAYPPALGALLGPGLAGGPDLRYPFREDYYYRRGADGGVVLLPPLP